MAKKPMTWGFYSTVCVLAAGSLAVGSGNLTLDDIRSAVGVAPSTQQPGPQKSVEVVQEAKPAVAPKEKIVQKPVKKPATAPAVAEAKSEPQFDVLRVEKDGSLIVAGRAKPSSNVEIVDATGDVVGKTQSDASGDFVIIPDQNLKRGDHELALRSTSKGGKTSVSRQVGILRIPEKGKDDLIAIVTEQGKPSRIIAKPEAASKPETVAKNESVEKTEQQSGQQEPTAPSVQNDAPKDQESEPSRQIAKLQPEPKPEIPQIKKTDNVEKSEPQNTPAATVQETAKKPVDKPKQPRPVTVLVEAVEIEGDQIFVAGAVPKGQTVRVYINNKSIGTARGTPEDRFLLSRAYKLKAGQHTVRADVVDRKSGEVLARAEVPLLHEQAQEASPPPKVAKVQPKQPEKQSIQNVAQAKPEVVRAPAAVEKPTALQKPRVEETAVEVANDKATDKTPPVSKQVVSAKPDNEVAALDAGSTAEQKGVEPSEQNVSVAPIVQPIRTGRAIIIKPGDNLWRISRKTYGRGIRYTTIYNANRDQIRNPSRIYVGQIFKLPETPDQDG